MPVATLSGTTSSTRHPSTLSGASGPRRSLTKVHEWLVINEVLVYAEPGQQPEDGSQDSCGSPPLVLLGSSHDRRYCGQAVGESSAGGKLHGDHTAAVPKLIGPSTRPCSKRNRNHHSVQPFAAVSEQVVQRAGHGRQDKIIYSRAVAMGKLPIWWRSTTVVRMLRRGPVGLISEHGWARSASEGRSSSIAGQSAERFRSRRSERMCLQASLPARLGLDAVVGRLRSQG